MWIDMHAHLYNKSDEVITEVLVRGKEQGVQTFINTAVSIESAQTIVEQCKRFPNLYGTVGISPFDVLEAKSNWEDEVRRIAAHKSIVAVGEIGLDKTNPSYPPFETQMEIFEKSLDLGVELDLPVIIHSRGVESQCVDICQERGVKKAVFHCFTGEVDALERVVEAGYFVSYSGIVTFKKNNLHEQVKRTPLEQLFIETDSPYLAPHPFRGKENNPALVYLVGKKVAELHDITEEKLSKVILGNMNSLFSIVL